MITDTQHYADVITPENADKLLKACKWERLEVLEQRRVKDHHVRQLAKHMIGGTFEPGTQIHLMKYKGEVYIINGQHRLAAIVKSGVAIDLAIKYQEATEEVDLIRAYSQHDVGLPRSPSEIYHAHGLPKKFNLTGGEAQKIASAIRTIMIGFRNNVSKNDPVYADTRDSSEIARLFEEKYGAPGVKFLTVTSKAEGALRAQLKSAGTMSVGIVSLIEQPEMAVKFWTAVAHPESLKGAHPCVQLANWLREHTARTVNHDVRARVVMAAWNAFVAKKPYANFDEVDTLQPVVLNAPLAA
jgi:hypothetical protein